MGIPVSDPRFDTPVWSPERGADNKVRGLAVLGVPLALWYFTWLLHPGRVGHPVLYVLLVTAELYNLVQAAGFWWTCSKARSRAAAAPADPSTEVDVFIPVYGEEADIVEPTVAAAVRMRGARVRVSLLDDGGSDEMESVASRHGAAYVRRRERTGAKAGNINHALARTSAPFVAVFDCDHVPNESFVEHTLGHFADPKIAFVQTPQYYANGHAGGVAGAAWAQQALFFGPIARGKDGHGAMFCCGTNVVYRRRALEDAGGVPEESLTEDFELSIRLHERGWETAYVPRVLASGVGPEDMASYVTQQFRWARGCLSALPRILRSSLPARLRLHYVLSAMFFLSGWTLLVYMTMPFVRLVWGAQPLAGTTANQFLAHFAPYFAVALGGVAVAGGGTYTFEAFATTSSSFWVHIRASLSVLLRRKGRFVVTPKRGTARRQPKAVAPALAVVAVLATAAIWRLLQDRGPATLNNVAFVALHVTVLLAGAWPALSGSRQGAASEPTEREPATART